MVPGWCAVSIRRREFAETARGVVRVRLTGEPFSSDVLAEILCQHPCVEILTGPDRYNGDRAYLLVRVAEPDEVLARLGATEGEQS
jgi:hypothetical protein